MRKVMYSFVSGWALSVALIGVVGCAIDESDLNTTTDELAREPFFEEFDDERAAAIAKVKRAEAGVDTVSANFASCGTAAPTSPSERVNDAAFTGAARQRRGSSTSCLADGALQPTDDALYFCWTAAPDGTWTYNQNLRTNVRGWTRDDLLRPPPGATIGGARNWCGF